MAYRRDRRKDVQLQELGYRVVRVLASDVHEEVEHVLEIVDGAVERLRSKS
jgi:very-short-patch-repair endonuclease